MPDKLTVLHPTDLSRDSQQAFAHALRIAVVGDSRIRVLHACKPTAEVSWDEVPTAEALLHRWGWLEEPGDEQALIDLGFEAEELVVKGNNTIVTLLNYMEQYPADLLVLATRGREGLSGWWHGSIAEPVARVSRTMTLFVPHGVNGFVDADSGEVTLRNILLPVVSDPHPQHAIGAARAIAEAIGAADVHLTMLYVGDPADTPLIHDDNAHLVTRTGDVVEGILQAAQDSQADLIAMTTEGRIGFLDAFRGSTTEQVLRRAECPVLAIPALRDD